MAIRAALRATEKDDWAQDTLLDVMSAGYPAQDTIRQVVSPGEGSQQKILSIGRYANKYLRTSDWLIPNLVAILDTPPGR